jgi:hypothetical protein
MSGLVEARVVSGVLLTLGLVLLFPSALSALWRRLVGELPPAGDGDGVGGECRAMGDRLSHPHAEVRIEPGRLPLRDARVDAGRPPGRGAVPDRGYLPQSPRLDLRGHERVYDDGGHAALGHRRRDALHPVLAQQNPLARGHRDSGSLRRCGAASRGRGGPPSRSGDLWANPAAPYPAHRRHREGAGGDLPDNLSHEDRCTAGRGYAPLRRRDPHLRNSGHGWVQPQDCVGRLLRLSRRGGHHRLFYDGLRTPSRCTTFSTPVAGWTCCSTGSC